MKILLTGSGGMVGRNIIEHPEASRFKLLCPRRAELDLLDIRAVESYLHDNKPDLIVHAAGRVGGIQANISSPYYFMYENMSMGMNLINAAKESGVSKFINIASSCMYPRNIDGALSEDLILTGELEPTNEGYALSKIAATKLCEYLNKNHKEYSYKTIIPCNLYGRFDDFDVLGAHMIPAVIRKIFEAHHNGHNSVSIWGDGSARREFMFAEDLADFVFYSIRCLDELPQNINVGIGRDYSVTEYYEAIADVVGFKGSFTYDVSKPSGMKRKLVDNSISLGMGWEPKTTLRDGIKKTLDYFMESVL